MLDGARVRRVVDGDVHLGGPGEFHDETSGKLEVVDTVRDGILLRLCGRRASGRLLCSRHGGCWIIGRKRGRGGGDGGKSRGTDIVTIDGLS